MITKAVAGAAIFVGLSLAGPAPASADPSPFAGLSCNCQRSAPVGILNPAEIERGLRAAASAPIQ